MTAVAPPATREQSRWVRLVPPALVVGAVASATIALHVRDPHEQGSWGACPTKALFGVDCPGCGGLRAVNDLTNFQIADAASSNLLFILALPLIAFGLGRWVVDQWHGTVRVTDPRTSQVMATVAIASLTVFTVLRNLPPLEWLAP